MTIAYQPGERWEDGPRGPGIDVRIESASRPGRSYRIVRDRPTGSIFHLPPCEAWEHGRYLCRHVRDALHRADDPDAVLREALRDEFARDTWWARRDDSPDHALLVRIRARLKECDDQHTANDAGDRAALQRAAFRALPEDEQAEQAFSEFG